MDIITFLNEPQDSVNREARISYNVEDNTWWVRNQNMSYMGTLNEIWSDAEMREKIMKREVSINEPE